MNEPPHLHIAKEKGNRQRSAKIWIESLEIADRGSLTDADLNQAIAIINNNKKVLLNAFNKVKEGKKITTIKFN